MAAFSSSDSAAAAAVRAFVLDRRRLQTTLYSFEDLTGIAAKLYSPEARMIYPFPGRGQAPQQAPDAVLQWFKKAGGVELVISVQDVGDDLENDRLFEWSYLKLVGAGGRMLREGKLIAIWRRRGNGFVIDVESFTHNA